MIFILSHIALTFSMLLTAYMGFRFFKIGRKNTGYSMFILSIEFLIRNVFDFYSLFDSLYWILPEALLLSGIIIFTHGIIQKKAVKTVERKTYRQESKISSSLSIRNKLLIGLTIISISTILLFYIIGLYNMNSLDENLESVSINEINDIRRDFYDQEASDSKTMSTALEVIIRDNDIKKLYLEGDRDKLYEYTTPLFEGLKNKYGITHFYFILLDGECFVRIHNKNIYGDLIKRTTFENAKRTKEISSGIELGKTAFALRTVVPYYDEGKLIGYVELGEEIDHFLDNLKEYTNEHTPSSEFAIMVEKRYLDEGDWKSVRQVAGLRDNWNDIKDYVLIDGTIKERTELTKSCFTPDNLAIKDGDIFFNIINNKDKTFLCGGFPLIIAGNKTAGVLFSLIDVSHHLSIMKENNFNILIVAITSFIITMGIGILIFYSITKPIKRLTRNIEDISMGRLETSIDPKLKESNDEIGALARAFDRTLVSLKLAMRERAPEAKKDDQREVER